MIERNGNTLRCDAIDTVLSGYVSDPSAQYEDAVCYKSDSEKFYQSLRPPGPQILGHRIKGYTYQEIANKTSYKTHSAVLKRIKRSAEQYLDFSDEQEGLREFLNGYSKIIYKTEMNGMDL